MPCKSSLAGAIHYALTRMKRLRHWRDHGFLELDNKRGGAFMRPIVLGRISGHMVNRIDELLPWRYAEFQRQLLWFLHRLGSPDGSDIYIISTQ